MKIAENSKDLQTYLSGKNKVGFVPTMGALHQGHMSLIRRAVSECEVVVCSIFVNPTQFNNPDDLKKYPRTLEADTSLLEENGCDILYLPGESEIYPGKYEVLEMDFKSLKNVMEGPNRPGHFEGVVTVVNRFFELVQPHCAYFGEKDFQQLAILKEMARQKKWDIDIIACPTVRETTGLASSSRNMRLSEASRIKAAAVYEMLQQVKKCSLNFSLETCMEKAVNNLPEEFDVEYLTAVDGSTLVPVDHLNKSDHIQLCTAVWFEGVRLIDNICIKKES